MPTLNDLVDEVKANLQGYALRQDRITYVANPSGLTTTSTQITVGSGGNLAKGIIEIDDELIWIDSFDKANNTQRYPRLWSWIPRNYSITSRTVCTSNSISNLPT